MRPPFEFSHLAGCMVYLWFPGVHTLELPFHRRDDRAADGLVAGLREYRPNARQLIVDPSLGMPDPAPDMGIANTEDGAAFYAAPHQNALPDTAFSYVTGFEIGLVFTTKHTSTNAWDRVRYLIRAHDQPGVDWLLISAGAASRDGQIFPTEELLARMLLEHPAELEAPEHIRRVTLHLWSTGEAHELYPRLAYLFGPLFNGIAPAHRPIHPGNPQGAAPGTSEPR